ncbi:hypothetical protein C1H46_040771 [Malus baccata]|uniref:Uncharacterized protein n=1 Tax=Malus baccata TaxID=106549 RepID=A0A540KHJ5_MALBA|nr:hypothetical protein C1H46_040771 [Malus baccata]
MNCAHQWSRSAINGPSRHRRSIQIAPEEVRQGRTGRPFLSLSCLDCRPLCRTEQHRRRIAARQASYGEGVIQRRNPPSFTSGNGQSTAVMVEKERNRTAELMASTGGALTLVLLCNKALFPIQVPIILFIKTGGL